MTRSEFKIDGMSCGHCVKTVTKALESTDGVVLAQVDLESKLAIVEYDPEQTNEDELFNAVRQADFTPVKKNA